MAQRIFTFDVGETLSPEGLLAALRAIPCETLRPLIPAVERHHASAQLSDDSLVLEAVELVPERPQIYALHFRYAWETQLGCSDVNYRDTERAHAHFTYTEGRVTFAWAEEGDRSTVDEF